MSISTVDRPQVFKNVKEAPSIVLFLIFVSEIGLNWLYVNFLYDAFSVPATHTDGLVQPLFVLSFLKCAFIILGVAFWIGKFGTRHLGLTADKFKIGLISTFFFWSLLQIILILLSSVSQQGVVFQTISPGSQPLYIVGAFLLFTFSKALYDEVIYRSLVLPQFLIKIRRFVKLPRRVTLAIGIAVSQLLYLIIQLPLLSIVEENEQSLTVKFFLLLLLSILNSLVYLQTKNTFIAVGLHALWYYPLLVADSSIPHILIISVLTIGFIYIWPMLQLSPEGKKSWPTQDQRLR